MLLRQTRTGDVIDAAVVLLAADHEILSSDPGDLATRAASGVHVELIRV